MAQKGKRACLQVEWIEPKQLLSSSLIGGLAQTPVLTMFRYSSTLAGVEKAVGTVAKTHEFSGLAPSLATLSARLPFGRQQVLPVWNNDLNIFDPNIRGSGLAMERQLLSDTVAYAQSGATEKLFLVTGRGSSVFYQDVPRNVEIARDPPNYPVYNFAVAYVTNGTGKNLSVHVKAVVQNGKNSGTYFKDFGMENKSQDLLYLAYRSSDFPGTVTYTLTYTVGKNQKQKTINPSTRTKINFNEFINNPKKWFYYSKVATSCLTARSAARRRPGVLPPGSHPADRPLAVPPVLRPRAARPTAFRCNHDGHARGLRLLRGSLLQPQDCGCLRTQFGISSHRRYRSA